jgi:hypothetical protein
MEMPYETWMVEREVCIEKGTLKLDVEKVNHEFVMCLTSNFISFAILVSK